MQLVQHRLVSQLTLVQKRADFLAIDRFTEQVALHFIDRCLLAQHLQLFNSFNTFDNNGVAEFLTQRSHRLNQCQAVGGLVEVENERTVDLDLVERQVVHVA